MVFNIHSLNSRVLELITVLEDKYVDILFLTETWLTSENNPITATLRDSGYSLIHDYREDRSGGGTAVVFKTGAGISRAPSKGCSATTFEFTCVLVKSLDHYPVLAVCIYRPGSAPLSPTFCNELNDFLATLATNYDSMIICGDFNVHFENLTDPLVVSCIDILRSYGISFHVREPTHINGGILDQICTVGVNGISSPEVDIDNNIGSDHYPVHLRLQLPIKVKQRKTISFRSMKTLDMSAFSLDLSANLNNLHLDDVCFGTAVSQLTSACNNLLDEHAPVLTKEIKCVTTAPWFDNEYIQLRKKRRKAERDLRASKKKGDAVKSKLLKQGHCDLRKDCVKLAVDKKKGYLNNLIDNSSNKSRDLYAVVNRALDRKQDKVLPELNEEIPDIQTLADSFNSFFIEKVDKIRGGIDNDPTNDSPAFENANNISSTLDHFEPATVEEIDEIIKECGIKCSPTDMFPTSIMKENFECMKEKLTHLVNLSLSSSSCDGIKVADIIPNVKNSKLDPNALKSYRPVSNLTFLGKLIERVVLRRLNEHLKKNNLEIPEQSAYKKDYSTETLLVRLTNDLLIASDNKSATVLMLLDLSAAFDTVDHSLLLRILRNEIGVTGAALSWFSSFLSGRSQRIRLGSVLSEEIIIKFGVPQGSVLGPVLFNLYIRSIYRTVKKLKFSIMGYADDHQIYKQFKTDDQHQILANELVNCFSEIENWMKTYFLQLNSEKTEIMIIGSQSVLQQIDIGGVMLSSSVCIRFVSTVTNLGIQLDNTLTFHKQVLTLKKKSFLTIRNLRKIRQLLTNDQLRTVCNSFVVSCLDYCNSMYAGINKTDLRQLQIIQNMAAKVVSGKTKRAHLGSDLKDLHWLPVNKRIVFKLCVLVFKSLMGISPMYLQDLLLYKPTGQRNDLLVPRTNSRLGSRAFSAAGPRIWNKLPKHLRQCVGLVEFKKKLKTYLFGLNDVEVNKISGF